MAPKVKPLRNEKYPVKLVRPWVQPPDTFRYKVKTGDTWLSLGARNNHQWGEHHIIWINFGLSPTDPFYTDQVNWYLREYVGCRHSLDGGKNWAFTDDADPGYIFMPTPYYNADPIVITGKPGTGGVVSAPQYDDANLYDTISKALDIQGVVDMGLSTLEIPLPVLLELGFMVIGFLAAVVGPAIAVGAPHNDALRATSRDFFFTGFSRTYVMKADNWSTSTVESFYPPLKLPPLNSVYPEKRETFRHLYNAGLKIGVHQAGKMNSVDNSIFSPGFARGLRTRSRATMTNARCSLGRAKEKRLL